MDRVYVFGDETGNLTFTRKPGTSRYFMICTVTMGNCAVGTALTDLRRELAWTGHALSEFHAHKDKQAVRNQVFDLLRQQDFRVDATILEKAKAHNELRSHPPYFYKLAWFLHFKYVAPRIVRRSDQLLVVASALQINNKRQVIHDAIRDVVSQVSPTQTFQTAFLPAMCDPCLQVADYAAWAIQRKWETGDSRSYELIKDKIWSEFDVFGESAAKYY
jgi:hypothetical protein